MRKIEIADSGTSGIELAAKSSPKQKRGNQSSSYIGQFGKRNCELISWSSLEEKDQKLHKKPENKTSSPLLQEGGKDKLGGGEGEKQELCRIQKEGGGGGTTQLESQEQIEAKMGNICSALKPPKKVRKIIEMEKLSLHAQK